jgi:hypothetical protein
MGGFLDLESPPTTKTKSNKGNQQPKWTVTSAAQRKPKTHQYSEDDHGDFRQTKRFDQRPPGPALKCWPLFLGTTSLHPRENWEGLGSRALFQG